MEVFWLKHLVLLGEDEDDAPKVGDQPCVDRLIAAIGGHKDVGNLR